MNKLALRAYPKINLALDVLKKTNEYHEVRTVLCESTALWDDIVLEEIADGIEILCTADIHPITNTAFKAATLLKKMLAMDGIKTPGVRITITKNIPIMGGLGGGSSDAAAVLKGLLQLWRVEVPTDDLRMLAQSIGMDAPFFLHGGVALAEHYGEKITPLPALPDNVEISIIPTNITVSTKDAYDWIDSAHSETGRHRALTDALINAIHSGDAQAIIHNVHNDFEEMIFEKYPSLHLLEQQHEVKGARVILAGSGGCLVIAKIKNSVI